MKKFVGFILLLCVNLCFVPMVFASTNIKTSLVPERIELREGDSIKMTLSFDDFEDIKKGINAYKATLEYDQSIFEEITQSDFESKNNWEGLKYNLENGEFVSFRKVGTNFAENVVQFTLKVRKGVEATTTLVKIKDIVTSEGKKDIFLPDTEVSLNIVKEQQEIPVKPIIPEKPGNSNNSSNSSKPDSSNKPDNSNKPSNSGSNTLNEENKNNKQRTKKKKK